MAKRRLTKQQQTRISKRVETHNDASTDAETALGVVVSHHGKSVEILAGTLFGATSATEERRHFRAKLRANLPLLVCGDIVRFKQVNGVADQKNQEAVIEQLLPRSTLLERPRPYTSPKPMAANLDQIVLVVAVTPLTPNTLVDRYLVAAAQIDVEVIIAINKLDCLSNENYHSGASTEELANFIELYSGLGYRIYSFSSKNSTLPPLPHTRDRAALINQMRERTSILVGQSGVGKSSMLNDFASRQLAAEGSVSDYNTKGKHTTTHSSLHVLRTEAGGDAEQARFAIIDSPGIREFGLWHLTSDQVIDGMPEIHHYATQCQFRDCDHQSSKGCRVIEAIQEHEIAKSRADSYRTIVDSIKDASETRSR